jgi:hypothetical protein
MNAIAFGRSPGRRATARLVGVVIICLVAAVGCSSSSPKAVVSDYLDAQIAGDGEAAWELLSQETTERLSRDQFVSDLPETADFRGRFMERVSYRVVEQVIEDDRAEVVVELTGPDFRGLLAGDASAGESRWFRVFRLVEQDDQGWRIVLDPLASPELQTVSGVLLERFVEVAGEFAGRVFDVADRGLDLADRGLDLGERGLDLGERFVDVIEREVDRVDRRKEQAEAAPEPRSPRDPREWDSSDGPKIDRLDSDAPSTGEPPDRPPRAEPAARGWQHKTATDPLTDEQRHVFWRSSQLGPDSDIAARLDIWCEPNPRLLIEVDDFLGFRNDALAGVKSGKMPEPGDFSSHHHSTVRMRVGDASPEEVRGRMRGKRQIELPEPSATLAQMLDAEDAELRVEVQGHVDKAYVLRFDLDGLAELLDANEDACQFD